MIWENRKRKTDTEKQISELQELKEQMDIVMVAVAELGSLDDTETK